jgi:hypothetical protein
MHLELCNCEHLSIFRDGRLQRSFRRGQFGMVPSSVHVVGDPEEGTPFAPWPSVAGGLMRAEREKATGQQCEHY